MATGAVGGVLSIRTVTTGLVAVPQVNVAVHWRVLTPSALISSAAGQPLVSTRSVGSTIQRRVTLLVCQPFEPAVPVSVKLIGAGAPGALVRQNQAQKGQYPDRDAQPPQ